jgi:flagellar L-ring protein precursor FlgH
MKKLLAAPLLILLGACQNSHDNLLTGPELTPVGYGLAATPRAELPAGFAPAQPHSFGSTWGNSGAELFKDIRAYKVGDVVTVTIEFDDKAQFDNESDRSRESGSLLDAAAGLAAAGFGLDPAAAKASGNFDINSNTHSRGAGSIDRSEKLSLSVAAVVTEVLPNGNMVISGTQEIRVNYEIRVLSIGGIVRPLDISAKNRIPYDRIAEARISYGGRGRLTDVQQPAWGQRLYDVAIPY